MQSTTPKPCECKKELSTDQLLSDPVNQLPFHPTCHPTCHPTSHPIYVSIESSSQSPLASLPSSHPSYPNLALSKFPNQKDTSDTMRNPVGPQFLRAGLTRLNLIILLIGSLMSIGSLVFLNAMQAYVLVDLLGWDRTRLGEAVGTFALADEILSVGMVTIWGFASDRIGRRIVFSLGLLIMGIAILAYPHSISVYPSIQHRPLTISSFLINLITSLLFLRLVFAMGASAATAMLTAFIGDYGSEEGRNKLAGLVGISTGMGALFAALILVRLPVFLSHCSQPLHITFAITSTLLLLTAALIFVLLAEPPQDPSYNQQSKITWFARAKIGLCAMKRPLVVLAYASGFVARADSIALNLFIASWVDNHLAKTGQCPRFQIKPNSFTQCPAAKRLTSNLMAVAHTTALLGAPLTWILTEKVGLIASIGIPALAGTISFGLLMCLNDPSSPLAYLSMVGAGLAEIGMIIASMALMANQSPPNYRGALAGVYSLFGAVGIIVTSKLGGYLFDVWKPTGSFVVVFGSSTIVTLLSFMFILLKYQVRS